MNVKGTSSVIMECARSPIVKIFLVGQTHVGTIVCGMHLIPNPVRNLETIHEAARLERQQLTRLAVIVAAVLREVLTLARKNMKADVLTHLSGLMLTGMRVIFMRRKLTRVRTMGIIMLTLFSVKPPTRHAAIVVEDHWLGLHSWSFAVIRIRTYACTSKIPLQRTATIYPYIHAMEFLRNGGGLIVIITFEARSTPTNASSARTER